MENPIFVVDKNIPLVDDHKDFDAYNTSNTSVIQETTFKDPDTTETAPAVRLRQKVKRDKLAVYRDLNVIGDVADTDQFKFKKTLKDRQH